MVGHERKRHHQQILAPCRRQFYDLRLCGGLQPFDRAGPRLEGQMVRNTAEMLHHQPHRALDVVEVGIAGIYERLGQAVGGEKQMDSSSVGKFGQPLLDLLHQSRNIAGMIVELADIRQVEMHL